MNDAADWPGDHSKCFVVERNGKYHAIPPSDGLLEYLRLDVSWTPHPAHATHYPQDQAEHVAAGTPGAKARRWTETLP